MLVDVMCYECEFIEEELVRTRDVVPACPHCGAERESIFSGGPRLIGVSPSAPIRVWGKELSSNTALRTWQAANPDTALVEKGSAAAKRMESSIIADQEKLAQKHGMSRGAVLEKTKKAHRRRQEAK